MNYIFTDPQPGEFYDKYKLAATLYPGVTVDSALPEAWVDHCTDWGFNPRPHVVWAYPKGSIFGEPRPVTFTGVLGLARLTIRGRS
jgi:hypothetical protein